MWSWILTIWHSSEIPCFECANARQISLQSGDTRHAFSRRCMTSAVRAACDSPLKMQSDSCIKPGNLLLPGAQCPTASGREGLYVLWYYSVLCMLRFDHGKLHVQRCRVIVPFSLGHAGTKPATGLDICHEDGHWGMALSAL